MIWTQFQNASYGVYIIFRCLCRWSEVSDRTLTSAHVRRHVVSICCNDSFPDVASPFLWKSSAAGTKCYPRNMLHEVQLVRIRASIMKQGQNVASAIFMSHLSFALLLQTVPQYPISYCPCNSMRPMRTHEGACSAFKFPWHVTLCTYVCRPLWCKTKTGKYTIP